MTLRGPKNPVDRRPWLACVIRCENADTHSIIICGNVPGPTNHAIVSLCPFVFCRTWCLIKLPVCESLFVSSEPSVVGWQCSDAFRRCFPTNSLEQRWLGCSGFGLVYSEALHRHLTWCSLRGPRGAVFLLSCFFRCTFSYLHLLSVIRLPMLC